MTDNMMTSKIEYEPTHNPILNVKDESTKKSDGFFLLQCGCCLVLATIYNNEFSYQWHLRSYTTKDVWNSQSRH